MIHCWVLLGGFRMCLRKNMCRYKHVFGISILFSLAFDKHPLLVLKKNHSDLPRHYHSTFCTDTIYFHSSRLSPSLQFQRCFKSLKQFQPHRRGNWLDGESNLFSLTLNETTFGFLFPSHHLVHDTRSVGNFTSPLV